MTDEFPFRLYPRNCIHTETVAGKSGVSAGTHDMKTNEAKDSPQPREALKSWVGVTADDIPPGWIDDMVKRLFEIVNRDMIRLEGIQLRESDQTAAGDPVKALEAVRQRERLATEIRRNLEKLSELETKRAQPRKQTRRKTATVDDDEALRELERRIAELAAARGTPSDSEGS